MRFPGVGDVPIKWYFTAKGKTPLPFATVYNSLNWINDGERSPGVPGEVQGAPRPWYSGKEPADTCDDVKGSASAWAGYPTSLIKCCPPPDWNGGIVLAGRWFAAIGDRFSGIGGVSANGSGPFGVAWLTSGGLSANGTGHFSPSWLTSGGLSANGTGTFSSAWTPTGGLSANGTGHFSPSWLTSGGLSANGTGTFSSAWTPTGGLSANGTGTFSTTPGDDVPTGAIYGFGSNTAPANHLVCDGSAVSRTTYAGLFAVIGTTFGVGDGSTTFNLPDLRGRSMLGSGTGSGLTPRTIATNGGEESHALTSGENASHTHAMTNAMIFGGGVAPFQAGVMMPPSYSTAGNTGSSGSGTAHNTMHPYQVVCMIIHT